ncbi:hypothetical protein LCM02_07995 [Lutimonas saemankumensis]|uniref:hypothetical protein n=1 Tax=Lutimonas saemankumensis TaxID=483016 RepID=UPI001CD1FE72|nr:hypothetical protein [Lutimonas saemankumensis]MCA0932390.1 hypothetical protein [Lutimonas saemankumensis]
MKKFLFRAISFFFPVALLFVIVELTVRNNTFKAKADYIKKNKENIEVMILGSSHNWRAVNPKYLSFKTAPLAHGGSAINIDLILMEKYLELIPNLKFVILELGYHNLEDYRDRNWNKNHLFHIYYGINNYDKQPPLIDNFLLAVNPRQYIKRFILPIKNQQFGRYNEYGFITDGPKSDNMFEGVMYDSLQIKRLANNYLENKHKRVSDQYYLENTMKLKKMVTQCLKNNISVIFLSPPKHYTYNDEMLFDKLGRKDKFLQSYHNYENVYIWNFEETYEYQSEMFLDPDHLNPKGAKIFSIKLDSLLCDLLNTNSHQRLKR